MNESKPENETDVIVINLGVDEEGAFEVNSAEAMETNSQSRIAVHRLHDFGTYNTNYSLLIHLFSMMILNKIMNLLSLNRINPMAQIESDWTILFFNQFVLRISTFIVDNPVGINLGVALGIENDRLIGPEISSVDLRVIRTVV